MLFQILKGDNPILCIQLEENDIKVAFALLKKYGYVNKDYEWIEDNGS